MPNVKIFVDETLFKDRKDAIRAVLVPLREAMCAALNVPPSACQLAVIPVLGLMDQPQANIEIQYLGTAARTPEVITGACEILQEVVAAALGMAPAVRATPLDPETYVALK